MQEAIISLRAKEKAAWSLPDLELPGAEPIGVEHHSDQERHSCSEGAQRIKPGTSLLPPLIEGAVSLSAEQS